MKILRIALIGGVCLFSYGTSVTTVAGAPAAKEDSSLSGVTQNWDKNLSSGSRFVLLTAFNNEAVRDNETGLVWEKTLRLTPNFPTVWDSATFGCAEHRTGGRMGWRLPSLAELGSLVDPTAVTGPTLPVGHPFVNVQASAYWSATTIAGDPTAAWAIDLGDGTVHKLAKTTPGFGWCVRGPMNADSY